MKRKIVAIAMIIIYGNLFLFLCSCAIRPNENEDNHDIFVQNMGTENEEDAEIMRRYGPTRASSIEELENLLILSRVLEITGLSNGTYSEIEEMLRLFNVSSITNITVNNISAIESFYRPSENAFEGFELSGIRINSARIFYDYKPIGIYQSDMPSFTENISLTLARLEGIDVSDPLGPIIQQAEHQNWNFYLSEDGNLLFQDRNNLGYNDMVSRIGNTWMRVMVGVDLPFSDYESMRTLALTEFTQTNIVSVDEMIAERFREREIVVTFPGMSGVTVSHFTDWEWVEVGTLDNSASFSVPNGTSHVRATRGSMEHTFMLPRADDFVTVLSVPTATLDIIGVSVYGDNVNIAQNDSSLNVPVPANVFFQSFGNEGEYWAILISKAGGNYPFVVTVTDMNADFSEYFYNVRVPAGVTNLSIQSNDTYIVDIADGISGGGTITLLKTGQPASMSFTLGGTARNVNFTLDGSDPFAGFR